MSEQITKRQLTAFHRFLKLLPHGKEPELVLLKGHLLIEEQIRLLIDRRLQNPEVIKEANAKLEAHQAIQLARAFFPPEHMPEIWKAIAKLNTIRNGIAHNIIDRLSLNDKIEAWVQSAPTGFKELDDATARFEITLWSMFEAISSLVDGQVTEITSIDGQGSGEGDGAA